VARLIRATGFIEPSMFLTGWRARKGGGYGWCSEPSCSLGTRGEARRTMERGEERRMGGKPNQFWLCHRLFTQLSPLIEHAKTIYSTFANSRKKSVLFQYACLYVTFFR
jgi:hypothetical protein